MEKSPKITSPRAGSACPAGSTAIASDPWSSSSPFTKSHTRSNCKLDRAWVRGHLPFTRTKFNSAPSNLVTLVKILAVTLSPIPNLDLNCGSCLLRAKFCTAHTTASSCNQVLEQAANLDLENNRYQKEVEVFSLLTTNCLPSSVRIVVAPMKLGTAEFPSSWSTQSSMLRPSLFFFARVLAISATYHSVFVQAMLPIWPLKYQLGFKRSDSPKTEFRVCLLLSSRLLDFPQSSQPPHRSDRAVPSTPPNLYSTKSALVKERLGKP